MGRIAYHCEELIDAGEQGVICVTTTRGRGCSSGSRSVLMRLALDHSRRQNRPSGGSGAASAALDAVGCRCSPTHARGRADRGSGLEKDNGPADRKGVACRDLGDHSPMQNIPKRDGGRGSCPVEVEDGEPRHHRRKRDRHDGHAGDAAGTRVHRHRLRLQPRRLPRVRHHHRQSERELRHVHRHLGDCWRTASSRRSAPASGTTAGTAPSWAAPRAVHPGGSGVRTSRNGQTYEPR